MLKVELKKGGVEVKERGNKGSQKTAKSKVTK